MTTKRIVAALDRPAPKSLGMVGLVVVGADGRLATEGVHGSQAGRLTAAELNDLIDGGHAVKLNELTLETSATPLAALWVGQEFTDLAGTAEVPVPPLPQQTSTPVSTGTFWVAPARHIWRVLDLWTVQAFRRVVDKRDAELARLMSWVLPHRIESRAARWLTADSDQMRRRDIDWWTRLDRHNGRARLTPERLTVELESIVERVEFERPKCVVGFSALAKGGDKEIAAFIAEAQGAPKLSFGAWLRAKALTHGSDTSRRSLQRLGQQLINQMGELGFCLTAFDELGAEPLEPFLIEGIRHIKVLDSVRSLVGPDRFFLAFVNRPEAQRVELLLGEGLSNSQLSEVLSDPTEQEIPIVRERADIQLDVSLGVEAEGNRLLKALDA